MRPAGITDNEVLKLSGYEKMPLITEHNIEVARVIEVATYTVDFFSLKHTEVLSLLLSRSISEALSFFYHIATT